MTPDPDTPLVIPEWLQTHMVELEHAIDNNLPTPDPRFPVSKEAKELREHNLTCLFERILDKVSEGQTVKLVLEFDHNGFSQGDVMRWIRKDAKRLERYREAQAIGAEVIADEMIGISDGNTDTLEDVQRSTLRINTRKWVLEKNNKERFGTETVQVSPFSGGITVVIGEVTPKHQPQLVEGTTYDG